MSQGTPCSAKRASWRSRGSLWKLRICCDGRENDDDDDDGGGGGDTDTDAADVDADADDALYSDADVVFAWIAGVCQAMQLN